jgi:hypothetical protein
MSHGSSGLAVHKVRCRGPEQQSKLNDSCDSGATTRLARRYHINVTNGDFQRDYAGIKDLSFWHVAGTLLAV